MTVRDSDLWDRTLEELRRRLSPENFETWLVPLRFGGFDGETLTLHIPNRFFGEWLGANYLDVLREAFTLARGNGEARALKVHWVVVEALQERAQPARKSVPPLTAAEVATSPGYAAPGYVASAGRSSAGAVAAPPAHASSAGVHAAPHAAPLGAGTPPGPASGLNPRYNFENYVVGPSNQLAHAAAIAGSATRGKRYNPLFIYGGVGLGKTHLVNAVGHRVLEDNPHARVLYLSAERFTNEFIWALQNHRIDEFRDRYRNNCDVLLMDDIQFLAGREQTQEEFFHTFNALYHADRQIVVTSDVYPQQISEMQERLISRFQWGLVADIQAPELDTRIAILKRKAEEEGIALADDVALFLAQVVKSNVRELEGTLLRLAVRAELVKRAIDLDFARETLKAVLPAPEHAVSVEDIQTATCRYFNIRLADLKSHRRHRAVSYPRMVAMYLCRQRLGTSYPQLGELFGGKDHTTVLSAVNKIGGLLKNEDPKLRSELEAIERKLGL
jgi:chromosomal replication initiator protein